jgi:transcription elongation factor Elf1
MEITACPICGSRNIGIGTLGDGIISGLSSWKEVCRNCGYQGSSLVFDSETEYQKFLDALSHKKQQEEHPGDTDENNQEQDSDEPIKKQILEERDETEKVAYLPEKKNYSFEFIISVILTIVFFIVLFSSSLLRVQSSIFPQNNLSLLILYLLGSFFGVLIFFFLLIVFLEMIYRSIRTRKK